MLQFQQKGNELMQSLLLSSELAAVLQTEAERAGKTLTALAEEWLRQHYYALRRQQLADQTHRFWEKQAELYLQYPNQYVAFYNDQVLDHDDELRQLALRVRATHGNLPIVLAQVTQLPSRGYQMRSPRLKQAGQ